MLVIKSYIEKSDIEGLGCFSAQKIEKGDIIWFLDPSIDQVFTEDDFKDLLRSQEEEHSSRFKKWAYKRGNNYILCADNAKFFNHSENPNCDDDNDLYTLASRDIEIGEEITCDYKKICDISVLNKGELYNKKK